MMSHTGLGHYGEFIALNALRQAGYSARIQASERFAGDIRVKDKRTGEISKIEVKTARQDYRGCWQFCCMKQNHTNHTYSDFVLLQAIDIHNNIFRYLIPSGLIQSVKITIASHPTSYAGKWSRFRVRGQLSITDAHETARLYLA